MARKMKKSQFNNESHDFIFKIIAIGSGGVGKTSLIRRFAHNKFAETYLYTLGVDFTTKLVSIGDYKIKIVCVDTAGQEYYSRLRPNYYLGGNGAIIAYDITDKKSFDDIPQWIEELKQHVNDVPMLLAGNKVDLEAERVVSREELEEAKEKYGMVAAHETSAKLGLGVDEIFKDIVIEIMKRNDVEI